MKIPSQMTTNLEKATDEVESVNEEHRSGLTTNGERCDKVIDIWSAATEQIANEVLREMSTEMVRAKDGQERKISSFNPICMMADSGARCSDKHMVQLAGIRSI
jgi:DNA-directed RNA polymerase subunit beta'